MGRPDALLVVEKQVDVDPSSFPTQLPLSTKCGFDRLDDFPHFPNGAVGFDRRNCIQEIPLAARATDWGRAIQLAQRQVGRTKRICQQSLGSPHRLANIAEICTKTNESSRHPNVFLGLLGRVYFVDKPVDRWL